MFRFFVLITTSILSIQISSKANLNPYDSEDEIREQVEELRRIISAEIIISMNKVTSMTTNIYIYRNNLLDEARLAIRQENDTLNEQITTLEELASSAGQDVGVCLDYHDQLAELSWTIFDSLTECVALSNEHASVIGKGGRYRLNIIINEVDVFDFELDLCAGDSSCMNSLVPQIQSAKTDIIQKIDTERQNTSDLFNQLQLLIKQCNDDKTADFIEEGGALYCQISDCVNDLVL